MHESDLTFEILLGESNLNHPAFDFLENHAESLLYHHRKYKYFLKAILKDSFSVNIVAYKKDTIVGVIPAFCIEKNNHKIINSLPFYGSNGGVILNNKLLNDSEKKYIFSEFFTYAKKVGCSSATMVMNVFETNYDIYDGVSVDYQDCRIGQITKILIEDVKTEDDLIKRFHVKTRNAIRKAQKQNFIYRATSADESLDFLYETHCENMAKIGGLAKPREVFQKLTSIYNYPEEYIIWSVESSDGEQLAAVLNFYCNKTVEYYTPVIKEKHRSTQALSGLIFRSLSYGLEKKFHKWNWGGTWVKQDGVYRFKSRWAAEDYKYKYYTRLFDKELLKWPKQKLLTTFPFYYIYPFSAIAVRSINHEN